MMKVWEFKNKKRKIYLSNRLQKIKENFNNNFNKKNNLKISLCFSGGGFRSMLATLGALRGLSNIGLLDLTYNVSSLSGSSWAILPWVLSGKNVFNFSQNLVLKLDEFYNLKKFSNVDLKKIKLYKKYSLEFYKLLLRQKKNNQANSDEFNFVDFYGLLISFIILDDSFEHIDNLKLYDLIENVETGNYPYPIFSAGADFDNFYDWFEFTPHYIGSKGMNYLLSSEFFDKNLISLVGILGSSFSISFKDIFKRFMQLPLPEDIIEIINKTKSKLEEIPLSSKRLGNVFLDNFAYGLNSPFKNIKKFPVFDGGYISNLPLEPLFNQDVNSNMIFIFDNAAILPQTAVLKDTEKQLLDKGFKLPEIDYEKAKKENISIFKGNVIDVPTIIYIPLRKDVTYSKNFDPQLEKFCSTTNFFYSKKQAEKLMGLTEHVVKKNKDIILSLL